MSLDLVESSIQRLLSVLYPPYEATAPTLLSQLFHTIDSHYQGDALRCFLDFLVPARHVLDTVQQAACAQYTDALFACEGWPLCLRDQVVVHLAPVEPQFLKPGDFYLQVTPFCNQSARIVVCSLLEEEGFHPDVVEETPIPETLYSCMFTSDFLCDINHGRSGKPLSRCLLATQEGLVRLPWEQVAVPDLVEVPGCTANSMASAPQSSPALPPSLPLPSSFTDFPEQSFHHKVVSCPTLSTSSTQPSVLSVETRICPAKHGIAVSLCLVDASSASSSQRVRVKQSETVCKPIGWVAPNTWDSRLSEMNSNTSLGQRVSELQGESKANSEKTLHEKQTLIRGRNMSTSSLKRYTVTDGEYIDELQASMLFSKDNLHTESLTSTRGLIKLETNTQQSSHRQNGGAAQYLSNTQGQAFSPSWTISQSNHPSSGGVAPFPHSQSHPSHAEPSEPPECVRTIRFAEKPCTPCMKRRQGGKISKAQELRCRYRDSYQAALQNPVPIGGEQREDKRSVVDEDVADNELVSGNMSSMSLGPEKRDPCVDNQTIWFDRESEDQKLSSVGKTTDETNCFSPWKLGETNTFSSVDSRAKGDVQSSELALMRTADTLKDTTTPVKPRTGLQEGNEGNTEVETNSSTNQKVLSFKNTLRHPNASPKLQELSFNSSETSKIHEPDESQTKPRSTSSCSNVGSHTVSQSRQDAIMDKRSSSLSTAVVETSEKCELVIIEGQMVRRKENTASSADVPQLHVVKCKNSTAFGLVSPKINRRKIVDPACVQVSTNPVLTKETKKLPQRSSARPRPGHLPLGTPDPRALPLYQEVACFTGCRDKTGRAIVELYGNHRDWSSSVTSHDLFQTLLYFHSITRKEIREAGLTLIFDARRKNPQPQLYKALMDLQEGCPGIVNSLVLLVDKENAHLPERCPGIQTDVVTSLKALLKLVELNQLSSNLNGTLSRIPCVWMEVHQRLFPFVNDLREVSKLLERALNKLERPPPTNTMQAVQQSMMDQKTLMRDVLEDIRLVNLQRDGGAMLARLKRESDLKYSQCEDLSDAVDSVAKLYNHVEEQAHILVQRTNMTLEHLKHLLPLRELEGHLKQIQHWFETEGERHLLEAESVEGSGDRMEQVLNSFTSFLIEASDRRHHATPLVSEAERLQQSEPSYPETEAFRVFVCHFKSYLEDFLCRAEQCGRELQVMVSVCDFCEQATTLASECVDHLNQSQLNSQTSMQSPQLQTQNSRRSFTDISPADVHTQQSSVPSTTSFSAPSADGFMLQAFHERFRHFSPERFQEVKAQASSLRDARGMPVWNEAWLRCQAARRQLQERMQEVDELHSQQAHFTRWREGHFVDVVSTHVQTASWGGQNLVVQSSFGHQKAHWEGEASDAVDPKESWPALCNSSPSSTSVACCNIIIKPEENSSARTCQEFKVTPMSPHRSAIKSDKAVRRRELSRARTERDAATLSGSHNVGCQWFPWRRGLVNRSVSQDSCNFRARAGGSSSPPTEQWPRPPSSRSHHGQPSCRILQEAQKFQISRHGSFCSEESCMSDQSSPKVNGAGCCKYSSLSTRRCDGSFCLAKSNESSLRLQRVMEELVFTEREYVRSLGYILTHYFPLMDKRDIPQDLRGKRGIIFGNLEKLYDFHNRYFLPELEACEREAAMMARCFLRHSESFGLYALYSKNKPQSDALILHRRHDIFKKKQQELGDMMDLSSYLLRPIQRISKYNLLLQDMLALTRSYSPLDMTDSALSNSTVCGQPAYVSDLRSGERERELAEIQAASDLVRFQMRHGNDLLTMDAIQDCEINLKEQGRLIRQDEFTVFFKKKKCVRRVFLFEDLILLSKPKRTDVGNDVYVYKESFKTNDIGMTHISAVSSLCFEIWFRRKKSKDTYTLKASSLEVKKAWTTDLEKILWDQAAHSRELRLQERVLMGMGRKHFVDIQPSEAAICNCVVGFGLPGRIPVACCSHRGLDHPRPHSVGSGSTASTTLSQSSSSSGRGSLPPLGYPGSLSHCVDAHQVVCSSLEIVTDNELNNHHLHEHGLLHHCQTPRALMDSTESSGEGTNPFSASDHCFVSAVGGESADDSLVVSQNSQRQLLLFRTPSLRWNDSPAVVRKKPGLPPKPPHLTKDGKVNEITIGKSTEV